MKKKMLRNLGILVAIIGVLAAIFVWVNHTPQTPPAQEEKSPTISLYAGEKSDVRQMKITNMVGNITLLWDENAAEWWMMEEPDVPVYQTKVGNLTYTVTAVNAQQKVEDNPTNLLQYGLDQPQATITVVMADGSEQTYYLGNDLSVGNETYFRMEGDPAVYTVPNVTWGDIKLDKSAFYDMTLPELPEIESVTGLSIERQDATIAVVKSSLSGGYSSDWIMTSPYAWAAENSAVGNDWFKGLKNLTAMNVFPPDGVTDSMGLASPRLTLTVETAEESTVYSFGASTDAGTYMTISGNPLVYLVSTGSLSFTEKAPFFYMSKTVYAPNISDVTEVELTVDGTAHTLTIANGQFTMDGEAVSDEDGRSRYGAAIGLSANGLWTKSAGTPDGKNRLTFTLTNGEEKVISFGVADERNMTVVADFLPTFTIPAKDWDDLVEKFK